MTCSALNPFFFILTPYTYSQSYSNSSPGPVFGGQVKEILSLPFTQNA
jgi:hypothetical protein